MTLFLTAWKSAVVLSVFTTRKFRKRCSACSASPKNKSRPSSASSSTPSSTALLRTVVSPSVSTALSLPWKVKNLSVTTSRSRRTRALLARWTSARVKWTSSSCRTSTSPYRCLRPSKQWLVARKTFRPHAR